MSIPVVAARSGQTTGRLPGRKQMMFKRGRHERFDCRHRRKRVTETAGIQRRVCERCGRVTVHYLYDVFAEEQSQLNAHPHQV
jgi:hypothetical protein